MKKAGRIAAGMLCITLFLGILPGFVREVPVEAAPVTITLEQAVGLALSQSPAYERIENKIEMQNIKYEAAVKSIAMKQKNMKTFRWSPLLNFKFPESPTLADEFEWQYKPMQITTSISELTHQLEDTRLQVREEISTLYVDIYILQEKAGFYEDRLKKASESLQKNKARLSFGNAQQSDVDKLSASVDKLKNQLANTLRALAVKKQKLKDQIHLDVTTNYTFADPSIQASIPRGVLENLVSYTLDHDQSYFEAKLSARLGLNSVNMMQSMMRRQYGAKMDLISGYIEQAKTGAIENTRAFKKDYQEMLRRVDAPWNGNIRILFIKIPKEWFKGAVDGSRYVEDDPYALYSEALEYADLVKQQNETKQQITNDVKDTYETIVNVSNSYAQAKKTAEQMKEDCSRALLKNKAGLLTFEELKGMQEEYEEQQMTALDLLSEYSKLLYSYDRKTCGAVSAYFSGELLKTDAAAGGISIVPDDLKGKARYYIRTRIEDSVFSLGISIPENFSVKVSHFALFVDGTQIGEKTAVSDTITHLTLDLEDAKQVKIYLYQNNSVAAVCQIDPSAYEGELNIAGEYQAQAPQRRTVGTYSYIQNKSQGTTSITIQKKDTEQIAFYRLIDASGQPLGRGEKIAVGEAFTYLSLMTGDMKQLRAECFDAANNLLYTAEFDDKTASLVVS